MVKTPALYKLKSEDGREFKVERAPMKVSPFINQQFIDLGLNDRNCDQASPVLVPFHSSIVELVIRWLYHHRDSPPMSKKIKYKDFDDWDKEFFTMESGVLFALLNASHSLGIEDLMNMGCAAAAQLIKGKKTEQIRQIYGIRTDEEQMEDALAAGGEGTSSTSFNVD